ncbi:oxidase ustYa family protein [Aspergillus tanneri]|uniref:Tat pathway signal sequence n=1 Tax=Aspergillus tanneri TaxID=1220188 RepID=A0A5M9ME67_9EURO|nr:uncharacterized protein ATNIH1004_006691 [Aspergillus tanneri]KAA8645272.1 hypothetical protein ATNIH1004_006691 [Aspergillus tanneri]
MLANSDKNNTIDQDYHEGENSQSQQVNLEDDESSTHGLISGNLRREKRNKHWIKRHLPYFLTLMLTATNIITLVVWRSSSSTWQAPWPSSILELDTVRNTLSEVEILGPADIPVEREMREFYTGITDDRRTEFLGPSNAKTDVAWGSLEDVGLIRLNEQQARLLGVPTAREFNGLPGSYVGVLEVFHQIHCLNRIRQAFYREQKGPSFESPSTIQRHTEHCFDYLRQSFMCLGDVNIGPVGWNETTQTYIAEGDGIKECRNFDKIHAWAKLHDTPMAPGNAALPPTHDIHHGHGGSR